MEKEVGETVHVMFCVGDLEWYLRGMEVKMMANVCEMIMMMNETTPTSPDFRQAQDTLLQRCPRV